MDVLTSLSRPSDFNASQMQDTDPQVSDFIYFVASCSRECWQTSDDLVFSLIYGCHSMMFVVMHIQYRHQSPPPLTVRIG